MWQVGEVLLAEELPVSTRERNPLRVHAVVCWPDTFARPAAPEKNRAPSFKAEAVVTKAENAKKQRNVA